MPHRIAVGSCSHPSLPQPLWPIVRSRRPAAFVWGGDAVYADKFAGLNWTAVGLRRVPDGNKTHWRLTFPPPSIHLDATPDIIRGWYEEQWGVENYQKFVNGWRDGEEGDGSVTRPIIFGTIDDHDYGQNNGDITYEHKKESNVAFVDFLYASVSEEMSKECAPIENGRGEGDDVCRAGEERRSKWEDPMYQRSLEGKGVYGVQLFDFSRPSERKNGNVLWGGGYWVPEREARIDPDVLSEDDGNATAPYSTTHSVAIFALDVRSNKTPWPKGKQKHGSGGQNCTTDDDQSGSTIKAPLFDLLGQEQWEWFQSALDNSRAAVNVIVSGLQIHPERFPNDGNIVEEWSKFSESRQLLYDTILNSGVNAPLLISGDVHMSQFMRKDCARSSEVMDEARKAHLQTRPLLEITTSGLTHSWGNSFSSQPKNHRWPLKPYNYFVSPTFMTVAHLVNPWNDILVRTEEDSRREMEDLAAIEGQNDPKEAPGGRTGLQYYLGLNFAELEFHFAERGGGGAVTVRIFGTHPNDPPKLESSWTFDQLSGKANLPGMTATVQDFSVAAHQHSHSHAHGSDLDHHWTCVPHRGLAPPYHYYAANAIMFLTFCFLFFLPHAFLVWLFVALRRRWHRYRSKEAE